MTTLYDLPSNQQKDGPDTFLSVLSELLLKDINNPYTLQFLNSYCSSSSNITLFNKIIILVNDLFSRYIRLSTFVDILEQVDMLIKENYIKIKIIKFTWLPRFLLNHIL